MYKNKLKCDGSMVSAQTALAAPPASKIGILKIITHIGPGQGSECHARREGYRHCMATKFGM